MEGLVYSFFSLAFIFLVIGLLNQHWDAIAIAAVWALSGALATLPGTDMAKTETRVLTAHVPVPLAEKVDQLADRLERSPDWITEQALSAWIAQEEERDRLTH